MCSCMVSKFTHLIVLLVIIFTPVEFPSFGNSETSRYCDAFNIKDFKDLLDG